MGKTVDILDIIGKRFGQLTVVDYAGQYFDGYAYRHTYMCKCDCGKSKVIIRGNLVCGKSFSCGCMCGPTRHRLAGTGVYKSWVAARNRCFNPNTKDYERYAKRGITMCDFIKESPENLLKLVGHRKGKDTIHRINNAGHYSCGQCEQCLANGWPLNVEWASVSEQNQHDPPMVTINGKTRNCYDWAMEYKQKLEREPKLESYDELFLTTY